MKTFVCEGCGSSDFHDIGGYRICDYCGKKHIITKEDKTLPQSTICLNEDVNRLLEKCRTDRANAVKYANRVLEIDPHNSEAQKIISNNSSGGCYVATAVYGSYDCPEVWTLRRYRDYTLAETWYGRSFIHIYYMISPTLVKWFGKTVWFKNMWKPKLDRIVYRLNAEGVKNTPYQDKAW